MRYLICFVLLFSLVSCEKVEKYRLLEYIPPDEIVVVPDKIDKTVAKDGSGDYTTIQAAIEAEYKSNGDGYKPGQRQPWSKQLTDEEAKEYTLEKILGTWEPC